jgi:small ligand-binding sensory domain FIST
MTLATTSILRFASALSRLPDSAAAGRAVAQAVRRQLGDDPPDLAFLFFSNHHSLRAELLCGAVCQEVGPRVVLGCSGEGVIGGGEEIETDPGVTLWAARLPGVRVNPLRLSFSQELDRFSVGGWPDDRAIGSSPVFVLLADPFSIPVKEVLAMLEERYPGAIAIGGLAGGGHGVGENRMVFGDEVYDGGLVGVALSGSVSIETVISQGCRPIGDRYVVTKAERNLIHELGGAPALERLRTLFASMSAEERRIAQRAVHLGIVIDEQRNRFERGDFLVRNLIGADQSTGAVAVGDLVQEGQTVQFHLRDAKSAHEDLNLRLDAYRARHRKAPLGALLFSCCGRGEGLFGRPHHDVSVLRERLGDIPIAGFFAQGEIGPIGGGNFLHGYTASVALFSEPNS